MKLPFRVEPKESLEIAFKETLAQQKTGDLYVVFIDGNSIKKVNDIFGHLTGDFVIYEIAETIVNNLRFKDRIIRFGGDEFVLLINNYEGSHIKNFIARIQTKIRQNNNILQKLNQPVTVSAGVVKYDKTIHSDLTSVLNDADKLMYAAKSDPPAFLKVSGDKVKESLDLQNRRKLDTSSKRLRSLFTWVVCTLTNENPEYDLDILTEAVREIWRINGKKILYKSSINEVVQLVKSNYIVLFGRKKPTTTQNTNFRQQIIKELNDFLQDYKDKKVS